MAARISDHAANACIYTAYAVVLVTGLATAWYSRTKNQFLSANGTRSGLPLAINFVASGLGASVISGYPQTGAYGGLQGTLVNAIASAMPLIMFAYVGPLVRRRCPEGFVLTEWIRQRYGICASLVFAACVILNMFLYMVGELNALMSTVEGLSKVPGLPVVIVEAVIVCMYNSLGGFFTSFLADNIQVSVFFILLVVGIITVGVSYDVDTSLLSKPAYHYMLHSNVLSWKMVYILPVSIVTNASFMANSWLRTFAAKSDKDLRIAASVAFMALFVILGLMGVAGMLSVIGGHIDPTSSDFYESTLGSFYVVITACPTWLSGFMLVLTVFVSSCTFDSETSALCSSISNDLFRNKVRMIWIRLFMFAVMAPIIIVALRATNVLNIWLIVDVLAACIVPVLYLGLSRYFYFITGVEVILSLVGGILTTFTFGAIYYQSASAGGQLLLMSNGLYGDDWGAFGAFVAAPVGSLIGAIVGIFIRIVIWSFKRRGIFSGAKAVFEKPPDGQTYFVPADLHWFDWNKEEKWYEHYNCGPWAKSVDYWIFEQDGDEHQFVERLAKRLGLGHPALGIVRSTDSSSLESSDYKEKADVSMDKVVSSPKGF